MAPGPEGRRFAPSGRAAALVAAIALALASGTCSDDEDAADDSTSTTDPSTTSSTPTPEDEVEAAYLAYWDLAVRLAQSPNPDDPEIAERASGEARGDLVDGLTTLRSLGQRSEFGPGYAHEVQSVNVSGDTALLEDCTVDDSRIIDSAGQTVVEGIGTQLLSVHLVRENSRWLVDRLDQLRAWEGAVECT